MKCFQFCSQESKENPKSAKSTSQHPYNLASIKYGLTQSNFELGSLSGSNASVESLRKPLHHSFSERRNNLRVFTLEELKAATGNFSRSLVVGEGGFGCVYRGTIGNSDDPNTRLEIAVKQLSRKGSQGHKEWIAEVNVLGLVDHPNLVKLVGYCAEEDKRGMQRLLIYEFMTNGNVEQHLSPRSAMPLSWNMRLKIALDAAHGLTYLHEELEPQIIFRDFKTSNILLDEQWNAKLSDFGFAREGPAEGLTHVSTAVVGTPGYADPEYLQTGRLRTKTDVWSYGVVLYELITGRHPLDRNRPKSEQKLLEWIKPYISDVKKFPKILDSRLEQECHKSAQKLAAVANRCLVRHPKMRPKMSEVRELVKRIVESSWAGSPQPSIQNSHGNYAAGGSKSRGGHLKAEEPKNKRGWKSKLAKIS